MISLSMYIIDKTVSEKIMIYYRQNKIQGQFLEHEILFTSFSQLYPKNPLKIISISKGKPLDSGGNLGNIFDRWKK